MKLFALASALLLSGAALAQPSETQSLQLEDIFALEYADQPEINADGSKVYFERHFMDIYSDKNLSNIWSVTRKNQNLQPVTTGNQNDFAPLLSPSGDRLAFLSTRSGKVEIYIKWLDTNTVGKISNLPGSPSNLAWSPDGKQIAFTMFVSGAPKTVVNLPGKPPGAKWAGNATYIDDVYYRFDGAGYLPQGNTHIFMISSEGGNARQLTSGAKNHASPLSWSADAQALFFSANLADNADMEPLNTEVHKLNIATGKIDTLTDRFGPDNQPQLSNNGKWLAYLGYDDKRSNYENANIHVMKTDGSRKRVLTANLDRSVKYFQWSKNSKGIYFQYEDQGKTVIAYQPLKGNHKVITDKVGGTALGRPYTSGTFDVAANGTIAFTLADTQKPADIAIQYRSKTSVLTNLNQDALGHKSLATIKEVNLKSSFDNKNIQAWVAYPANFDSNKKYPLLLEIHGGPVAAYGPQFSSEVQLFAAQGYVVLYVNPRGSSSYGKAFAQLIDENYPSQDYDDLMSAVDHMIAKGFIDSDQLYVTGGSGGGTLTSWIIGHTDRFRAAVVAKPVINWFSFVLTSDYYPFFAKYWFAKNPWEDIDTYMKQSPISYVGNVTTPTMLLTGEDDYRTPMAETEQYYQALKLKGVKSALVRIPGASHGIYKRPSNLMSKVAHILYWFEQHNGDEQNTP